MQYLEQQDQKFQKYFTLAFLGHLGILVLFYALQVLLDLNILELRVPPRNIEIIKSAVKVDIVGMPKMTLKELKNIDLNQTTTEQEIEQKPIVVEPKSEKVFKEKAEKIDLKNLLSDFSNKEVAQQPRKKKKLNQTALRNLVLEGNKVSQGSSTTGDILDLKNQAYIEYVQSLPDQVRPQWKLPSYLTNKGLQCRIRIYISNTGKVLRTDIIESSGEAEYDQKALLAVKKSSPLSPPPREIFSRVSGGDVVLGFPL